MNQKNKLIKEEKKQVINISNNFLQAQKSTGISINGFRILSLALANAEEIKTDDYGSSLKKVYQAKIKASEMKYFFATNSNQSSKLIKKGFDNLIQNYIKDPKEEKYYPIFAEIDYKNKTLIFNPLIFNDKKIDLKQINNFSRIILPRLSEDFVKSKKLSKNAFSLELLLQSFQKKYEVNIWRLREQLGLVESDPITKKVIGYKYNQFKHFNHVLKKWINEINNIEEEQRIINDLTLEVIKNKEGKVKKLVFTFWKKKKISFSEKPIILKPKKENATSNKIKQKNWFDENET